MKQLLKKIKNQLTITKPDNRTLANLFFNTNIALTTYIVLLIVLSVCNIIEISIYLFFSILLIQLLCVAIGTYFAEKCREEWLEKYTQKVINIVIDITYEHIINQLKEKSKEGKNSK